VFISVDTTWHLAAANRLRVDSWRAVPRSGPFHGFDATYPATVGRHFVCVVAGGGGTTPRILGCRTVDVSPAPIGSLDATPLAAADRLRIAGWAATPGSSTVLAVSVKVDGVVVATGRADRRRDDVGAAYPRLGPNHGVDLTVPVGLGRHVVCLEAVDPGGPSTVVGCRAVVVPDTRPRGSLDAVRMDGGDIVASGWADDPDGDGSLEVTVGASRTGVGDPVSVTDTADRSRPDVAAALGVPPGRGFTVRIPAVESGTTQVCAAAHNQNFGVDRLVGCRVITVVDHRPVGSIDSVTTVSGDVSVTGWFADPDSGSPVTVRVVVDGTSHTVVAGDSRPDVGAAYPAFGASRGFHATISGLGAGAHEVCVVATDVATSAPGLRGDTAPACGTALVGSIALGTSGRVGVVGPVGPSPRNALSGVDRDGGVSVALSNGSTLWLFADSMGKRADGSLKYFVNNTAAWAAPGVPAVTYDTTSGSSPIQFATPDGSFPACSAYMSQVMWPMSAVALPASGGRDRVVVYLANMCVSPGEATYEPHGVAVAEWVYDPTTYALGTPIRATLLAGHLFADVDTAEAAVVGTDGLVYVYGCDGPANGGWPTEYGPCTVARVSGDQVANASAYRYWDGSGWVAGSGSAMSMPDGRDGVTNLPPGGVDVEYDPTNHLYVMGYSPWPGFTNQVALRFATSPQGPWTAPVVATLPGCDDTVGGQDLHCYAAAVQPRFSTPGAIGLGWYDQAVASSPVRGAYLAGRLALWFEAS
jgi:hypothetical protein